MSRGRRRFRIVVAVALGVAAAGVGLAGPAQATTFPVWPTEQAMVDDVVNRFTYIYDVGVGHLITQEQFNSGPVSAFYRARGFDENFMLWAPIEPLAQRHERWMACDNSHGGLCGGTSWHVGLNFIDDEIGDGPFHAKHWDGAFIGDACGNWNRAGSGPTPQISGTKYEDLNADGVRQPGEPGLPGWTITLHYNGTELSTTTAGDGSYSFALDADHLSVGAGTYTLTETPQAGWTQSHAADPVTVTYGAGETNFSGHDFGNYRTASIGGRKFEDLNADGAGAGDPGVPGWTITYSGRESGSVDTDAQGNYSLTGLTPGTYTVSEQARAGWNQSLPGGADTYTVTVASGQDLDGRDFGNWRPASVQGRKFDDHGADGSGTGDPGLKDWTIGLDNGATTTTGDDGGFAFTGLKPGTYTLDEHQQPGWRQTAPVSGTPTVTLTSGQVLTGVEFGNVCTGTVKVTVPDGVGVRIEEVAVPGRLANDPLLPRSATGATTLGDLLPGTYRVTLTLPDGVFTTDPGLVALDGGFAVVKTVTVTECTTTPVVVNPPPATPGKITGGVRLTAQGGYETGGFEFMQAKSGAPRGTLEFNDHAGGPRLHTSDITRISVSGNSAYVFGHVTVDGHAYAFRLHLVDAGEPGTSDRFELMVANGYSAGGGATIHDGNIQLH